MTMQARMARAVVTALATVALTAHGVLASAPAIAKGTNEFPVTANVNVRTAPSTQAPIMGEVFDGKTVKVLCQDVGTTVRGNAYWNFIEYDILAQPGRVKRGYISDYFTSTGQTRLPSVPLGDCPKPLKQPGDPLPPNIITAPSPGVTLCSTGSDYHSINQLMLNKCELPSPSWDLPRLSVIPIGDAVELRGIIDERGAHRTCSAPPGSPMRRFFIQSCAMHDYGYELIRQGLYPKEAKASIDELFQQSMYLQCNVSIPGQSNWIPGRDNTDCKYYADIFYNTVLQFGGLVL